MAKSHLIVRAFLKHWSQPAAAFSSGCRCVSVKKRNVKSLPVPSFVAKTGEGNSEATPAALASDKKRLRFTSLLLVSRHASHYRSESKPIKPKRDTRHQARTM